MYSRIAAGIMAAYRRRDDEEMTDTLNQYPQLSRMDITKALMVGIADALKLEEGNEKELILTLQGIAELGVIGELSELWRCEEDVRKLGGSKDHFLLNLAEIVVTKKESSVNTISFQVLQWAKDNDLKLY